MIYKVLCNTLPREMLIWSAIYFISPKNTRIYRVPGWFHTNMQSNINGSNIFWTMKNSSRQGFEPLRVNHGASSGSKWR